MDMGTQDIFVYVLIAVVAAAFIYINVVLKRKQKDHSQK
jgi:hypothetical protein